MSAATWIRIIAALSIAAAVWSAISWHAAAIGHLTESSINAGAKQEATRQKLISTTNENADLLASKSEISRLMAVNKETQDDLKNTASKLAVYQQLRTSDLRLRDQQSRALPGIIASATTDALRGYAGDAERDIAATEDSRSDFGQKAVRASATAHALNKTLQARDAAVRARLDTARDRAAGIKQPTQE